MDNEVVTLLAGKVKTIPQPRNEREALEGLVRDAAGPHEQEASLLLDALHEDVLDALLGADANLPVQARISATTEAIIRRRPQMKPEYASWAVTAWAAALGLTDTRSLPNLGEDQPGGPLGNRDKTRPADEHGGGEGGEGGVVPRPRPWWRRPAAMAGAVVLVAGAVVGIVVGTSGGKHGTRGNHHHGGISTVTDALTGLVVESGSAQRLGAPGPGALVYNAAGANAPYSAMGLASFDNGANSYGNDVIVGVESVPISSTGTFGACTAAQWGISTSCQGGGTGTTVSSSQTLDSALSAEDHGDYAIYWEHYDGTAGNRLDFRSPGDWELNCQGFAGSAHTPIYHGPSAC
jgi:hypothetical protein